MTADTSVLSAEQTPPKEAAAPAASRVLRPRRQEAKTSHAKIRMTLEAN